MSRLQSAAGRVPQGLSFGDWPLRRKLAAALALPVLLAFFFGGLRVKTDFDAARQLTAAADTVTVIGPVVEYNIAVQKLAAAGSVGGGGTIAAIRQYENAAANLRIALKTPGIPDSVKRNGENALTLGKAVRQAKTQKGFSDIIIDKSANIATLLSTAVSDLGLTDDSASAKVVVSLQDAIAAQRALTGQQLNLANTDDAAASMRAIGQVGAETAALVRLQAAAAADDSSGIRQLLNENARRNFTLAQANPGKQDIESLDPTYVASNAGYATLMADQLESLKSTLRDGAASHKSDAIVNATLIGLTLLAALLLVLGLLRSLLNPIRAVRAGALEIANRRLPEAVAAMRDGGEPPAFEPIPVTTHEEMGQLARAVDDLHNQALNLAGEQARLRVQVGHMFETLSRRSTSLIDQQLTLIERLESDEEDPKRLQSLFRLDHLAARMRRNSDSLLVLAGTSTRRGVSGAISVSDAVRAAVSEVENYERIDIGDTSNDKVLGAVGSDLIHLIAEVVDNALAYSPPTTRVAIRGARTPEGGLLVEVTDKGLGMPPKDLASLNDRLANGGDVTTDTARRMGLFVVGSLAKRHGIAVRLRRNGEDKQGITVSIHLPAGLLADSSLTSDRPRPAAARSAASTEPVAPTTPAPSAVGGTTKSGLPTRVRGASGAPSIAGPSPVPGAKKALPTRIPGAHGPNASTALPAPAKPVIEGSEPADDTAVTNGADANGHDGTVNGHDGGHAAEQVEGASPAADGAAQVASNDADGPATKPATAGAEDVTAAEAASGDGAQDDKATDAAPAAQEPKLSPSGLPMRRSGASNITAYREFEDAPSIEPEAEDAPQQPAARSEAPAKGSRLMNWLPGRAKAQAEAARAAAEAEEPRQMPSNLSAWLDHRAKMVEAAQARETDAPELDDSTEAQTAEPTETEMHVPDEWVAEAHAGEQTSSAAEQIAAEPFVSEPVAPQQAAAEQPVPADEAVAESDVVEPEQGPEGGLPTRVPGATAAPAEAASAASDAPAAGGRPGVRAHNSSFFGARRRPPAGATQVVTPEAESAEQAAEPVAGATPVVEETAQAAEPVAEANTVGEETASALEQPVAQEPVAEEPVAEEPVAEEPVAEEPVAQEPVAQEPVREVAPEVEELELEPVAELVAETEPVPETEPAAEAQPVEEPPAATHLNDTPIFRAMMSRWLTDDTDGAPAAWSPSAADEAWSAAARVEEQAPLQESAAGLPMRRPGSRLVPGAINQPATPAEAAVPAATAAPAASRRDPETIRRNLNRHQKGVSAARTEAQDGTHREEADVHH